jgi:hypothetical protein
VQTAVTATAFNYLRRLREDEGLVDLTIAIWNPLISCGGLRSSGRRLSDSESTPTSVNPVDLLNLGRSRRVTHTPT